jgi:4-hydroxy-3-methylbut-2-enyl diphosphate reductase
MLIHKTCPRVKRVHEIVSEASGRGLDIIVTGTPGHPEVNGIVGWCKTKAVLLNSLEEAGELIPNESFSDKGVCLVSQTTFNEKKYKEIYEFCARYLQNIEYHDTICDATKKRQNEVRELAATSDVFIIVGGKNSSNVTKLFEIASEYCRKAYHIESAGDLDPSMIIETDTIVIAGGTSTPDSSVEDIIKKIEGVCAEARVPFNLNYYSHTP